MPIFGKSRNERPMLITRHTADPREVHKLVADTNIGGSKSRDIITTVGPIFAAALAVPICLFIDLTTNFGHLPEIGAVLAIPGLIVFAYIRYLNPAMKSWTDKSWDRQQAKNPTSTQKPDTNTPESSQTTK